jgi:hypothetical protein
VNELDVIAWATALDVPSLFAKPMDDLLRGHDPSLHRTTPTACVVLHTSSIGVKAEGAV